MAIKLYDTLSRTKKPFTTIEENQVKMYVCGPTVYDYLHIGNFRGPIFFNLVRNWFEASGYNVTYVYNYTDVDDKIIKRAIEEKVESTVISERYIEAFREDFNRLGLKAHDHNPKVTEFIDEIVQYVDDLVKKEKAYVIDGEVFYSIESFETYGKLSGKKLEDLNAGQRVEVDQRKRNPLDFVLWKPSKEGEPAWDSPWGRGRPGWHIECSAMIRKILGESIDIHGGGIDLIFPHHENEIAQGQGCCDATYCHYWMHNEFVNLKDQKMSKSLGNVITARAFMDKYDPEILKYVMLSSHYRSLLNMSEEKIQQSISGLARVYTTLKHCDEILKRESDDKARPLDNIVKLGAELDKKIESALNDDFNTQGTFAALYEMVRAFNATNLINKKKNAAGVPTAKFVKEWISKYGSLMALFQDDPVDLLKRLDAILIREKSIDVKKVEELIEGRNAARADKDWAESDRLRDELLEMGITILDSPEGTVWEVSK
ncbi:MAG: cysteine--tRNA ligase [Bacteriovoracaceae bacterium]